MKKLEYMLYISDMQPPTKHDYNNILDALDLAQNVIILLSESCKAPTYNDPFSPEEKYKTLLNMFSVEKSDRFIFITVEDDPIEQNWIIEILAKVDLMLNRLKMSKSTTNNTAVMSSEKTCKEFSIQKHIISFDIAENIETRKKLLFDKVLPDTIHNSAANYINHLIHTHKERFDKFRAEYKFIEKYKKQWEKAPYPVNFVTVDAIVIQSGHVLMIQRKHEPGKDMWAIPGGFLNTNERIEDGFIRELIEETKLKVPEKVIKGNVVGTKVFDDPHRSLRGRTITHAFAVELNDNELPRVKGADDAKKAQWLPINKVLTMKNEIFEDHLQIIKWALSKCKQRG